MNNKNITRLTHSAITIAAILALAACGGGGGGGSGTTTTGTSSGGSTSGGSSSGSGSAQTSSTNNVSPAQYASGSVQSAVFSALNSYRQQCGFPALTENSTLDTATQNHVNYMVANVVGGDSEKSGLTGYTGANYQARATAQGYPSTVPVGGVSNVYYNNATLTNQQYATGLMNGWIGGVYHVGIAIGNTTGLGIGESQTTSQGNPEIWAALSLANPQPISGGPVTFPCQGVTGIPYGGNVETPTPPNSSASGWGTPVVVMGNPTDTIVLSSGTMTDTTGNVITLKLLTSANDPNSEIQPYEAVAYSASLLQPSMTYSVSIAGTDNGTPFSRSFTFTTGASL